MATLAHLTTRALGRTDSTIIAASVTVALLILAFILAGIWYTGLKKEQAITAPNDEEANEIEAFKSTISRPILKSTTNTGLQEELNHEQAADPEPSIPQRDFRARGAGDYGHGAPKIAPAPPGWI